MREQKNRNLTLRRNHAKTTHNCNNILNGNHNMVYMFWSSHARPTTVSNHLYHGYSRAISIIKRTIIFGMIDSDTREGLGKRARFLWGVGVFQSNRPVSNFSRPHTGRSGEGSRGWARFGSPGANAAETKRICDKFPTALAVLY